MLLIWAAKPPKSTTKFFYPVLTLRKVVWSCYQEEPVDFRGYSLYEPAAYPEAPLSGKITWRVTQPWSEPADADEKESLERARQLIERLRAREKLKSRKSQ